MNTTGVNQASSSGISLAAAVGAALVALALGAIIGHYWWPLGDKDDRPAKYVLYFGNSATKGRVTVNETAFREALGDPKPNWKDLTIRRTNNDPEDGEIIDLPVNADPTNPALISRINLTQDRRNSAPCTLHVTQKVGLNNKAQVEKVLAALVPE
ncbi:MAG: hypothetical protein M3Q46_15220 [Verrucomicrobiota bacterium]|nr:hypothetical protein [Verrucomicrobiota bacterium]